MAPPPKQPQTRTSEPASRLVYRLSRDSRYLLLGCPHSIIFSLFEIKSVDDVGAGRLRETHTNPHAVHGRFTLKDDCERRVWNAGAAS